MKNLNNTLQASVIIVGGGPVGSTLALGLAHYKIHTILIDHLSLEDISQSPDDGRALAIAAGARQILEDIKLWPSLASSAEPIQQILTINGNDGVAVDFKSENMWPMGYIIEMYRLRRFLAKKIQESSYIQWIGSNSIENLDLLSHQALVRLKDKTVLQSMVVIAADGKNSATRSLGNIETTAKSYNQKAMVFTLKHTNAHNGFAYEKFLPTGTFAILPMTKNRSSIVWTVANALAEELLALSDLEFNERFATYLPIHYQNVERITPIWSYPLGFAFPATYIKNRFALAGDAAHVIHPLAGQGLNLGFRDVKALLNIFSEAYSLGLDLGSTTLLKRYEMQRRPDHLALLASTDFLNRFFSNNNTLLEKFHHLGLSIFNDLTPLKKGTIRYAMGKK